MSCDRLEVLRERNKLLFKQLKLQRENLELLSGVSESRKRGREGEETVTRTDEDRGHARTVRGKPATRFADTPEKMISRPPGTSKHSGVTTEHVTLTDLLTGSDRNPRVYNNLPDTRPLATKSSHIKNSKDQTEVQSRVTFQSDEGDDPPASFKHYLQPLLGYDWIAGVLDTEDSVVERPDEFFNDLWTFRLLNKDECIHDAQADDFEEHHRVPPVLADKDEHEANTDSHQCTFSYRINSRLFPVPLHSQECCAVCKKHKSAHPHTAAEPALIRVSIPSSALLPPYKYKAHRRCSIDPTDSLGLPSHCLSGWSNTGQNILPPPVSLDLRSSLTTKSSLNKELEEFFTSRGARNPDHIPDVSRLARHNFQHFSPKRKMGTYPIF